MITVTRLRPAGGKDRYGDPADGAADEESIPGCAVAPRMSEEPQRRGRQGVVTGLTLYVPPGWDIRHTDQFRIDGKVYDVEGEPGVWDNPHTDTPVGIEVALSRATG